MNGTEFCPEVRNVEASVLKSEKCRLPYLLCIWNGLQYVFLMDGDYAALIFLLVEWHLIMKLTISTYILW